MDLHCFQGRGGGGGGGGGADRPFRSMSKNYTKLVLKPLNKNY